MRVTRRELLKGAAVLGAAGMVPRSAAGREAQTTQKRELVTAQGGVIQPYEDYGLQKHVEWTPNPNQQFEIRKFNFKFRRA